MRLVEGPLRPLVAGVPENWADMLDDPDPARVDRAMQAMLGMKKLDIAALQAAADAV